MSKTYSRRPVASNRKRAAPIFWVLVLLSLLTMAAGVWWLQDAQPRSAAEAQPATVARSSRSVAPDFTLQTADGDTVRLQDLRGKVVLLNFWATWCPPCKAEMPDLDALHQEYGMAHDFTVIGVNMEEDAAKVQAFVAAYHVTFPLLLDSDGRVSNDLFAIRSLPTSMIIDRDGRLRDAWVGQLAKDAMLARVQRVW